MVGEAAVREDVMATRIVLVDINPKMISAWRSTFEENPEVQIVEGSMLAQRVDAWVTPTNAKASMDGGLDAAIKGHFGPAIERRVQAEIRRLFGGLLAVGHATCVPTGKTQPSFLISTPTMAGSSEDISDTLNVALACAAAFQAVHMQNAREPGSIQSVALPGLGANTGARADRDLCRPDVDRLQPVPASRLRRLRRDASGPGSRVGRSGAEHTNHQKAKVSVNGEACG